MKQHILKYALGLLLLPTSWIVTNAQDAAAAAGDAKDPFFMSRLFTMFLLGFAFAAIVFAIFILYRLLTVMVKAQQIRIYQEQGLTSYLQEMESPKTNWWSVIWRKLEGAVPVEREEEIMFDHSFDGIRELDNRLPPWWVWMFYITIFWAVGYYGYYHLGGGGPSSKEEYNMAVEDAKKAIAQFQSKQADLVNENTVTMLTDENALGIGKTIFTTNCMACHGPDGQGMAGLGPNFTDNAWKNGCSIKDLFVTIKNGIPQTAMASWSSQLRPADIQKVASYILSLQGTTPPNPKEPEGQPCDPNSSAVPVPKDSTTVTTDSTKVQ